uniref:Uncharacterized protein n=1 Tax=Anguilla anguilla TaxID=7936 RepID=A0A0E9S4J7_ANGAN
MKCLTAFLVWGPAWPHHARQRLSATPSQHCLCCKAVYDPIISTGHANSQNVYGSMHGNVFFFFFFCFCLNRLPLPCIVCRGTP